MTANLAYQQDHAEPIEDLIEANEVGQIIALLKTAQPVEIARSISRLDNDPQAR